MRRMTAVSPYRHWHFFDAYPPGYLRAVYRGNGIPLPWGNMSLVSDPCPRWAVFRLLQTPDAPSMQRPEIADFGDAGRQARAPVLLPFAADARCARRGACAVRGRGLAAGARCAGFRRRGHRRGGRRFLPARRGRRRDSGSGGRPPFAPHRRCSTSRGLPTRSSSQASVICPRSGACPRQPQRLRLQARRDIAWCKANGTSRSKRRWARNRACSNCWSSGKTLTGSLSDAEHHVAISDGRIEGNRLSWSAKITKPMRLSFKFTATVDEDRISGAARHLLGTRDLQRHAYLSRSAERSTAHSIGA